MGITRLTTLPLCVARPGRLDVYCAVIASDSGREDQIESRDSIVIHSSVGQPIPQAYGKSPILLLGWPSSTTIGQRNHLEDAATATDWHWRLYAMSAY
ncbi:hypothetical protein Cob_v001389 [Colletotrichum orbiculare MAFF 240422]|uniref:Uncharacterized protein n=1 Tax=Colletotrichum orbiculare (strain 104-T / ATCC 96160 / CBS 514.97 / LARS 414 / MAFF 240422) TaxID=1213857 RepID=A0A484G8F4_COLOR|nr:hypothetical protein Cob_v001389 [Colletotrichum orbiculare MAFF 240422]